MRKGVDVAGTTFGPAMHDEIQLYNSRKKHIIGERTY